MTYKQIEASRELRLWLGQVIIPAVGTVVILANPEVRSKLKEKVGGIKEHFRK